MQPWVYKDPPCRRRRPARHHHHQCLLLLLLLVLFVSGLAVFGCCRLLCCAWWRGLLCLVPLLFFLFVSLFRSPVVSALSFCVCFSVLFLCSCGERRTCSPGLRLARRRAISARSSDDDLTVIRLFRFGMCQTTPVITYTHTVTDSEAGNWRAERHPRQSAACGAVSILTLISDVFRGEVCPFLA